MAVRTRDRVPTDLTLPADLVAEVDGVAGAWAGRDDLPPEWATADGVVEWVRALRTEVTDPGPEV